MADKCEAVITDALPTLTSSSLTDRAACSQNMHTDTGHDYVTALAPKREYYSILTLRDAISMPSDRLVCVSEHVRVCPTL